MYYFTINSYNVTLKATINNLEDYQSKEECNSGSLASTILTEAFKTLSLAGSHPSLAPYLFIIVVDCIEGGMRCATLKSRKASPTGLDRVDVTRQRLADVEFADDICGPDN